MDAQFGTLTEVYCHVHNEKFLDKVLSETSHILEVMQYLDLPKAQMVKKSARNARDTDSFPG